MRKKILAVVLAVLMVMSVCAVSAFADEKDADSIVILFTNDVHCAVETKEATEESTEICFGYAGVAGLKKDMQNEYENVLLVDAGDFIQGGAMGALSKGEYIVEMMNAVPYDVVTLGNHEFDYSVETLKALSEKSDFSYVSSNFVSLEDNKSVFDAYKMVTFGDVDVALVGITTPEAFTKSTPAYFKNDKDEFVYGFCQGNEGKDLYDNVQATVDAAVEAGAEYVVALAHLGSDEESKPWTASEVIANVSGIDAMIDGHSHNEYTKTVKDKDNKDVVLAQTGTALSAVGKLVIDKDGKMDATMVTELGTVDEATLAVVNEYKDSLADKLNEVVAKTTYDLTTVDPVTGDRIVRSQETNLGDLCADAYRDLTGADVAFVNGGGVRATIKAGDITFQNIIDVHPFGNVACMVEVTGQQIVDALELGASAFPGESGGFLQVSGLTYAIDPSVESTVVKSDEGEFVKVEGARRVVNVKVAGEAIDLEKTYTLASHNYMLKNGGDGYTMFKGTKVILDEIMIDNEVLITYIQKIVDDKMNLPDTYANPYGAGRITVVGYGDANSDGAVDMLDVVAMQQSIAKLDVTLHALYSDLNGDEVVNMVDVVILQKYIAKLYDKLPVVDEKDDETTDTEETTDTTVDTSTDTTVDTSTDTTVDTSTDTTTDTSTDDTTDTSTDDTTDTSTDDTTDTSDGSDTDTSGTDTEPVA